MGDGTRIDTDGRDVCYACGKLHDNARLMRLPDGSEVGLQSKAYALYCESKTVLSWTKARRTEYMERVEKARGTSGREELAKEILRWYEIKRGLKR
jgi:hypothetical protein